MIPGGPYLGDAILAICPNARFIVRDEDVESIEWFSEDIEQPSTDEIMSSLATLREQYLNSEYQRNRANAYPSIGDQLDALFHAGLFPEEMASKIQAVKDLFPKPTVSE